MGHICICIAILLLSLTGGMFLLAKTKKDNLGSFHMVISWFVIVLSLACLLYCGIRSITGCGKRIHHEREIMICGPDERCAMPHEKMRGCHNMMRMEMKGDCCDMEKENCCKKKMECGKGMDKKMDGDCCKKKNMECIKDSVIVK